MTHSVCVWHVGYGAGGFGVLPGGGMQKKKNLSCNERSKKSK